MLKDSFGRDITYLRLSVTDRCDFRCTYCMADDMVFEPKRYVLRLEELALIAEVFVELGVRKIRVTGGEPLIRHDLAKLLEKLAALNPLEELCLTTNASKLADMANTLKSAGVDRINISLDTLREKRFRELTRYGDLNKVLRGIDAAHEVGFKRLKLNAVVLKNYNFDEVHALTEYALNRNMDISFIEEMPLGSIHEHARDIEFVSSAEIQAELSKHFSLDAMDEANHTEGPSRYWRVQGHSARVGFISPHSQNFCASCNRVRVTATGRLLLCLGNEHSIDLRGILRKHAANSAQQKSALIDAITSAMQIKPERHEFDLQSDPQILRFMNTTGG